MNFILRNSPEHFAAIAAIDCDHNRLLIEARATFLRTHPGANLETNSAWLELRARLDAHRREDLGDMGRWVVDALARQ